MKETSCNLNTISFLFRRPSSWLLLWTEFFKCKFLRNLFFLWIIQCINFLLCDTGCQPWGILRDKPYMYRTALTSQINKPWERREIIVQTTCKLLSLCVYSVSTPYTITVTKFIPLFSVKEGQSNSLLSKWFLTDYPWSDIFKKDASPLTQMQKNVTWNSNILTWSSFK